MQRQTAGLRRSAIFGAAVVVVSQNGSYSIQPRCRDWFESHYDWGGPVPTPSVPVRLEEVGGSIPHFLCVLVRDQVRSFFPNPNPVEPQVRSGVRVLGFGWGVGGSSPGPVLGSEVGGSIPTRLSSWSYLTMIATRPSSGRLLLIATRPCTSGSLVPSVGVHKGSGLLVGGSLGTPGVVVRGLL